MRIIDSGVYQTLIGKREVYVSAEYGNIVSVGIGTEGTRRSLMRRLRD